MAGLLELTPHGLYCRQADVFIDPWKPVDRAIITHAHSDHAKWGMKHYLAHHFSENILKLRLGEPISLQTVAYRENININGVDISLHPAGHIPGSAQVRLDYKGRVTVVSGDYKVEEDGLSTPFEPVSCHEFVSECTFGLPIYKWAPQQDIYQQINKWWQMNASNDRNSVIFGYALGKAQRILNGLNRDIGEVYVHGAVHNVNQALAGNGVPVFDAPRISADTPKLKGALIVAPPSAMGTQWMKKFSPYQTAICSGWMNIRGARRRRAADAGFVLSDHADWNGLNQAIQATGAEKVFLTHGSTAAFAKYLKENSLLEAVELETLFTGGDGDFSEA
jgi:putative mRNA 3-end processing factor